MDVLAFFLILSALVCFAHAASGRKLRHLNGTALGQMFLMAGLICQFTAITGATIRR